MDVLFPWPVSYTHLDVYKRQSVAWGELYQALQQGVVDSAENDYTSFMLKEHHKTPNGHYISETHHDYTTRLLLMNGAFYDGLTDEQKGWIDEAVEAVSYTHL